MQFFEYYLLYAFNWTLLLSLGLSIFRFNLKHYYYQIIVSALLLSYVSANIQYFDKGFLTAIVQPICAILCLRLIFRIHWAHSIIIIGLSYGINIFAEFLITYVIHYFEVEATILYIQNNDIRVIGFIIFIVNLLLIGLLQKFRLGFTFISNQEMFPRKQKRFYKQLLLFAFFSIISVALSGYVNYFMEDYIFVKQTMLVVLFIFGIRLAYQIEKTG